MDEWFRHFEGLWCLYLHLDCLTLEDKGTTVLQSIGNYTPTDTASYPRRLEPSVYCFEDEISQLLTLYVNVDYK
jgi:hypothetical protein